LGASERGQGRECGEPGDVMSTLLYVAAFAAVFMLLVYELGRAFD
jgi:hypothetical protein